MPMDCVSFMTYLTWTYWGIAIVSTISAGLFPFAKDLSSYGKLRRNYNAPTEDAARATIWETIGQFTLPKRYFLHFYLIGATWGVLVLGLLLVKMDIFYLFVELFISDRSYHGIVSICNARPTEAGPWSVSKEVYVTLALFVVHSFRRVFESLYITKFSKTAQIHLFGYLIGATFYLATVWSFVIEPKRVSSNFDSRGMVITVALVLFLIGQIYQYQSHRILASLRDNRKPETQAVYGIPKGGLFKYVSSPHYFAEILIYLGFLLLNWESTSVRLMFIFVCLNLSTTAFRTHTWYNDKFEDYPSLHRKIIIPFIF